MIYISLGCGTQSTALYWLSHLGTLPKADYAIFADTQNEPQSVYNTLEYLKKHGSIPIIEVTAGNLLDKPHDLPFFVEGGGMVHRQCTKNFKITPIQKKARDLAGLKPYQRAVDICEAWIGITTDETRRAKQPTEKWVYHTFPLITEMKWNRDDCVKYLAKQGIPVGKSSCVFCPYKSDQQWRALPLEEFKTAVDMDWRVRDLLRPNSGFLHSDRVPLTSVCFNENQQDMFGEECLGYCGV